MTLFAFSCFIAAKIAELISRDHQHVSKNGYFMLYTEMNQDQDQDSLLVKRRNDNHSP